LLERGVLKADRELDRLVHVAAECGEAACERKDVADPQGERAARGRRGSRRGARRYRDDGGDHGGKRECPPPASPRREHWSFLLFLAGRRRPAAQDGATLTDIPLKGKGQRSRIPWCPANEKEAGVCLPPHRPDGRQAACRLSSSRSSWTCRSTASRISRTRSTDSCSGSGRCQEM